MSSLPIVIFPKDKEARVNHDLYVKVKTGTIRSLQVDGDLGTDVITIKYTGIDKTDLTDAYDADGLILVLSQKIPSLPVYGSATLHISKPVTTNDVGLRLV